MYVITNWCPLFSLDVRYSAEGEIYKPVRSKNKHTGFVLTTFAVVHCCFTFMNLLSPLSPPFFLLSLHSPPSPPPPPRFPNNFLAFHFFPCPSPGKRRERAARLSLLSQLIFTLDPLLHRLEPVDELGCCPIMLSHKAPEGFHCAHWIQPSLPKINRASYKITPSLSCLTPDSLVNLFPSSFSAATAAFG